MACRRRYPKRAHITGSGTSYRSGQAPRRYIQMMATLQTNRLVKLVASPRGRSLLRHYATSSLHSHYAVFEPLRSPVRSAPPWASRSVPSIYSCLAHIPSHWPSPGLGHHRRRAHLTFFRCSTSHLRNYTSSGYDRPKTHHSGSRVMICVGSKLALQPLRSAQISTKAITSVRFIDQVCRCLPNRGHLGPRKRRIT